jgi:hypothetical protein
VLRLGDASSACQKDYQLVFGATDIIVGTYKLRDGVVASSASLRGDAGEERRGKSRSGEMPS